MALWTHVTRHLAVKRRARPALHTLRVEPASGWQPINLRELWQYRELLYLLTWRDVTVRYKQTLLGSLWAILQPVLMMTVFTLFFGAHLSSGPWPYPLFVMAGLLPWIFVSSAIGNAGNSVLNSEKLITKVYFPRLTIPIASVLAAVVDLLVAQSVLLAMMLWYGMLPGVRLLVLPLVLLLLSGTALGIGSLVAALSVAYRDFRHILPFLIQLWLFATPTVYMEVDSGKAAAERPAETVAGAAIAAVTEDDNASGDPGQRSWMRGARWLIRLNPLTDVIAAYRASVLNEPMPWSGLARSSAVTAALLIVGCLYFRRVEASFADII